MITGTIIGSTGNQYIDAKIEWESVADPTNNRSTVTAALYYKRNNTGFTTSGTGTFTITINGVKASANKYLTITNGAWVLAVENTVTVNHSADGTKSIGISATGSIPDTSLSSTAVNGTVKLETIARASTIDSLSCATKYFTGKMTYKYTPKSASHYNRCVVALNLDGSFTQVKVISLGQQTAAQKTATVTLSEDELAIIYKKLPSTTQGVLRFTFRTYSDSGYSTQVGDAGYKEISLSIPNTTDTQPTATVTISPVSSLSSPFNTLYIKGRSKIDVNFTDAAGKYGASVVSYQVSCLGKNYGSPYTTEYITEDGDVTVTATLKDSRGFSRTYTKVVTFFPYANPRIIPASGESEIVCARCDSSGNLSDSGTYLKIKAKRSYSKVVASGSQKNFCSIRYRYKAEGGSYSAWTTILATNATSDEVSTGALLSGALALTKSYVVQVGVVDTLGEEYATTANIPTDKVYMHRAGHINALGIGKYAEEENTVDIAEDIKVKARGGLTVGDIPISDTGWIDLGVNEDNEAVMISANDVGRNGAGCYYRVINGNHVYVAFNCACTYSGSLLIVNKNKIPSKYCPARNAYAMVPTGGRAIIRAIANHSGNIVIDFVQLITATANTASADVNWIDGYIDYWV